MSRARTRRIEGGIERQYRKKGRSASDSRYIAGAVMGNIKRERAVKQSGGYEYGIDIQCVARRIGNRRAKSREDVHAMFRDAVNVCIED